MTFRPFLFQVGSCYTMDKGEETLAAGDRVRWNGAIATVVSVDQEDMVIVQYDKNAAGFSNLLSMQACTEEGKSALMISPHSRRVLCSIEQEKASLKAYQQWAALSTLCSFKSTIEALTEEYESMKQEVLDAIST